MFRLPVFAISRSHVAMRNTTEKHDIFPGGPVRRFLTSPRARDTRATDSVFGSCVILRNSAVVGNRPESPAGIYINPGGLEGVRVRINRFTAPAKGVRVWQFTVRLATLVRSMYGTVASDCNSAAFRQLTFSQNPVRSCLQGCSSRD